MSNQAYQQWKTKMRSAAKAKRLPVEGQYELTPACNLDCKMCYVHNADSNRLQSLALSTEQWKRIFDEAYDCGLMFATLTGGECLMRKDFKELYLHLWNKRVRITVLTNGTLIDEDYIAFFQKYRPEDIQISLYGSSEEGYWNVTGHKSFHKADQAIRALKAAGLPLRVAVTPSSYIASDYINTIRYIKEQGIQRVVSNLYLLPKRDNSEDTKHYLSEEEILRLSRERTSLFRELTPCSDLPEVGGPMSEAPAAGLTCSAGNILAYVTWDGKMHPCGAVLQEGASLLEMSYAEAWEKTKAEADAVAQAIECDGCAYRKACPTCPAVRLTDLHSGHCNPRICELTRQQIADGSLRLGQRNENYLEE